MNVVTGEQFKVERTRLGVSQTLIGKLSNVPRGDLSAFENGREFFGKKRLARVNAALDELQEKQREAERAAAETDFLAKVGGAVIAEVVGILSAAGRSLPISEASK